jgi:hypothetical protein
MTRYLPYSIRPLRLFGQLISDITISLWTVIWVFVGIAVHDAIATIAEAGRQVESGSKGVAGNLASAGRGAHNVPLLGDALGKPLDAASDAALELAGAGHSLDTTASWLAWVLALAVTTPPILAVTVPWLLLRWRFFRRKLTVSALAATAAGQQLLALRALANRSPAKLAGVSADPVGGWRHEDPVVIAGLAAIELRAAGIGLRTTY